MRLPSARILATMLAEAVVLIVFATLASFFLYQGAQNRLSSAYEARYRSYLLASEMRTSSDDLTSLARLYVVTGDPKFRQEYNDVLAIRDGREPRPREYNRIYWDFVSAGTEKPRPDGPVESFEDMIRGAGFTGAEFAALKQAEDRSNALAKREDVAMNAAAGLFADETGAFVRHGEPDRKSAVDLMFSSDYLKMKADIMAPIDQFFGLMDKRTNLAVVEAADDVRLYRALTIVFLVMLAVLSFGASWSVLRLRHLNEEKWTTPLLQSGWSAIPNIIIEKQAALGLDPIDMNIVIHLLHSWTSADEPPSPTVEVIAKEIGVSVRTVQKHIAELQTSGLITRVERRNTRLGSAANLYSLDGLIRAAMPFTTSPVPALPQVRETPGDMDGTAVEDRRGVWGRLMIRLGLTERG